jgi:hypothetical protein
MLSRERELCNISRSLTPDVLFWVTLCMYAPMRTHIDAQIKHIYGWIQISQMETDFSSSLPNFISPKHLYVFCECYSTQ